MAVIGKREYRVYLDEETTEYVRAFLDTTRNKGGLSGLLNGYLKTMEKTLKASGYKPGQKLTAAKLFRIGLNGIRQEPV